MMRSPLDFFFHNILRKWNEERDLLAKVGLNHGELLIGNAFAVNYSFVAVYCLKWTTIFFILFFSTLMEFCLVASRKKNEKK